MNDKEWHRPKKPYTVTPQNNSGTSSYNSKPYEKKSFAPRPKQIVVPAKNNSNNKILHECMRSGGMIKLSINNALCTDADLAPTYEGKIVSFDDFTLLIETFNGSFMINKSAIAVLEFVKNDAAE